MPAGVRRAVLYRSTSSSVLVALVLLRISLGMSTGSWPSGSLGIEEFVVVAKLRPAGRS